MNNRREFIKNSATAAAGMFLFPQLNALETSEYLKKRKTPFGIQLYTLRDVLENAADPILEIQKLAGYGYTQIESYEGPKGIYWGLSNKEFQKRLQDVGLTIISSHANIHQDLEKKIVDAAEIGMKYIICPHVGEQKSFDDYKKIADQFNQAGKLCNKHGLRFAYHNHAYSFKKFDNVYPQDIFCTSTDPSLVDFEMDMYWVVNAGEDVEQWLKKYPGRFRLCHIKDQSKNDKNTTCTLGTGDIDYKKILKTAKKYGMKYFIVEQEHYQGTTPMKCAEDNAAYLKHLRF